MTIEDAFVVVGTFATGTIAGAIVAYYKKRAELSAEKEMIAVITNQIETVKKGFNKELETLKSELWRMNSVLVAKSSDERSAIYKLN